MQVNHVNLDISLIKKEYNKEFSKYEWRAVAIAACAATIFASFGTASLAAATSLASLGVAFIVVLPIFAVISAFGLRYFEEKTHFWGKQIAPIVVLENILNECNQVLEPFEKEKEKEKEPEFLTDMLPYLTKRAAVYCQLAVHGQVDKLYKAKADLASPLKACPENPQVLAIQGEILRIEKNYKNARNALDTALNLNSDDYYILTSLAELARQFGDREAAIKQFEVIKQLYPGDFYVLASLTALQATSVWEKCKDYFERSFYLKTVPNRISMIDYTKIIPKKVVEGICQT